MIDVSSKLKVVNKHPLIAALVFNAAVALLIIVFMGVSYETCDDYYISKLICIDGEYGAVFVNYFLAFALGKLYALFSAVNVFAVFLLLTGFVSAVTIAFVLLKRFSPKVAWFFVLLVTIASAFDLFARIQFTKASMIAVIAGVVLLVYCLLYEMKKRYMVCGIILLILGSLIRFQNGIIGIAFLCCYWFVFRFIECIKNKKLDIKKLSLMPLAVVLIVTLAGTFGTHFLSQRISFGSDEMQHYSEMTSIRSNLLDYEMPDYDENAQAFQELGFSRNDYGMFASWHLDTNGFFDKQTLEAIVDMKQKTSIFSSSSITAAADSVLTVAKRTMLVNGNGNMYVLFAIVSLILLLFCTKQWWHLLFTGGLGCALYMYLNIIGRCPYRVQFGIWLMMAVLIIMGFDEIRLSGLGKKLFSLERSRATAICLSAILLVSGLYQCVFVAKQNLYTKNMPTDAKFEQYLDEHDNSVYLNWGYEDFYNYQTATVNPLVGGKWVGNLYNFGDWTCGTLFETSAFKSVGIENKYRDMIDNPQVFVVSKKGQSFEMLETYLYEHYVEAGKAIAFEHCENAGNAMIYKVVSVK